MSPPPWRAGPTASAEIGSGALNLDLRDDYCPWNAGLWRLEVSAGRARVARTGGQADLTLDANSLGSMFLGGSTATALAAAGRVEETAPRRPGRGRSPLSDGDDAVVPAGVLELARYLGRGRAIVRNGWAGDSPPVRIRRTVSGHLRSEQRGADLGLPESRGDACRSSSGAASSLRDRFLSTSVHPFSRAWQPAVSGGQGSSSR